MPLPKKTFDKGSEWGDVVGAGETALTVGSMGWAEMLGGFMYLEALSAGADPEEAEEAKQFYTEQAVYNPKSEAAQSALTQIGKGVEWVGDQIPLGEIYDKYVNANLEKLSPAAAAGAKSVLQGLQEFSPLDTLKDAGKVGALAQIGFNKRNPGAALHDKFAEVPVDQRHKSTGIVHGSPKQAIHDEFLDEFVGTGETGSAFGWGHYLTESPRVSSTYYKLDPKSELFENGKKIDTDKLWEDLSNEYSMDFAKRHNPDADADLLKIIADEYQPSALEYIKRKGEADVDAFYYQQRDKIPGDNIDPEPSFFSTDDYITKALEGKNLTTRRRTGSEYEVIAFKGRNPDSYQMADWYEAFPANREDALIKELKDGVIYKSSPKMVHQIRRGEKKPSDFSYQEVIEGLNQHLNDEERTSKLMKSIGIDGVQYPTGTWRTGKPMPQVDLEWKNGKGLQNINPQSQDIVGEAYSLDPNPKAVMSRIENEIREKKDYLMYNSTLDEIGETGERFIIEDLEHFVHELKRDRVKMSERRQAQNYVIYDGKDISVERAEAMYDEPIPY